jgi:hypothetical protein
VRKVDDVRCAACEGDGIDRKTGANCLVCGGTGLGTGDASGLRRRSRRSAQTFKTVLLASLAVGFLVLLNHLPSMWRWADQFHSVYRACMKAQPDVSTITKWFRDAAECQRFAGRVMRERDRR